MTAIAFRDYQSTVEKPAPKHWSLDDISLAAQKQRLADNPKRDTYTSWLNAPSEISADIYRVHYDLVYDPNPLSLDGGVSFPFRVAYEGWGCYPIVKVTITFKVDDGALIAKKITRDMCKALSTGGSAEGVKSLTPKKS